MEMPELCVVIPCYNDGKYLSSVLQSLIEAQGTIDLQVIIVNDGSTDNFTLQLLSKLKKKNYIIIDQPNSGLGAARNAGIRASNSEYILPLDSDNKVRINFLRKALDFLKSYPEFDVVYGDAEFFGQKQGIWKVGNYNLQKLMLSNYIDACALFRKSLWEKLNGYDEKMPVMGVEDWDFWLRASFSGSQFYYMEIVAFDYFYHQKSMIRSLDFGQKDLLNKYIQQKHNQYLNRSLLNEIIYKNLKNNYRLLFFVLLVSLFPFLRGKVFKSRNIL